MNRKKTNIKAKGVTVYFLPVATRVPLKFGPETCLHVTCARIAMTVTDPWGRDAQGWGETPLNVQWVWPGKLSYQHRDSALQDFTVKLARAWVDFQVSGHPIEIGHLFVETELKKILARFNASRDQTEQMPWLAALL